MGRAAQVTPHFSVPPSIPQPPWPLFPSLSLSLSLSLTHAHTHRHTHRVSLVGSGAETVLCLCSNAGYRALVKWDYRRSYAASGLEVDRGVSREGEHAIIRPSDSIMGKTLHQHVCRRSGFRGNSPLGPAIDGPSDGFFFCFKTDIMLQHFHRSSQARRVHIYSVNG